MATFKEGLFALMIFMLLTPSFLKADSVDDYLGVKYYFERDDNNFDNVLTALGLDIWRMVARLWAPVDQIKKTGDNEYTYLSNGLLYNLTETFTPGVKFPFRTIDGRNVTCTMTIDGPTLKEVQEEENERRTYIYRTFSNDTLVILIRVGQVTAARIHKTINALTPKDRENLQLLDKED